MGKSFVTAVCDVSGQNGYFSVWAASARGTHPLWKWEKLGIAPSFPSWPIWCCWAKALRILLQLGMELLPSQGGMVMAPAWKECHNELPQPVWEGWCGVCPWSRNVLSLLSGKVVLLLMLSSEVRRGHKSCTDKGWNGDVLSGKPLASDFISSTVVEGTQ